MANRISLVWLLNMPIYPKCDKQKATLCCGAELNRLLHKSQIPIWDEV